MIMMSMVSFEVGALRDTAARLHLHHFRCDFVACTDVKFELDFVFASLIARR